MDDLTLAVDPGLRGALAILTPAGDLVHVDDLPTYGSGSTAMVNAADLAATVRQYRPARAVVEQVNSMPREGVSSAHRFGRAVGSIVGVLAALEVPVEWVTPAKWKREMRLGDDKEDSRKRATEAWPKHAGAFRRAKDHNKAEAALLGQWAVKGAGQ